ncbi:hypothetical protein [Cyclobacterium sp. SYSU L10401]|uniref:hypothetical protein n=1 Tax=Cyclobacterium sp. SYSU L10401 TaxID=2678657 RepID=UPI0013D71023|nr:hypothetical protein [Cyclobacterium sp. SYSU L10401]
MMGNFRFQMGLIRAYFDAHIQQKLMYDTQKEQSARNRLRLGKENGSQRAIDEAIRILERPSTDPGAYQLKQRCEQLG